MRVPPQRSSRSNTAAATSPGGKRASSLASSSNNTGKKRKVLSVSPSGTKRTSTSDASTSNHNVKRKQQQVSSKKSPQQLKKTDAVAAQKLLKAVAAAKKAQLKTKIVPLVGLKKIKIKEGKVTIKKILMTANASKAQKKQQKAVSKTVKKQSNAPSKKMTGASSVSANETFSAQSTSGDQAPGNSSQNRAQVASKLNTKIVKAVKKNKVVSTTPVHLTRTKKLPQRQKLKSVKKVCLKKVPLGRNIIITQEIQQQAASQGAKKKLASRKKQVTTESISATAEGNVPPSKLGHSPSRQQHEVKMSSITEDLGPGEHIISVVLQTTEKSVKKGSNKKTKDEECAIKKIKKKIVKRKPKMEDARKECAVTQDAASAPNEVKSESTKEKPESLDVTPKKQAKADSKENVTTKAQNIKRNQRAKITAVKSKLNKKSPIAKSVKIVSTKLKKHVSPKNSPNSKVAKKVHQPKKTILKAVSNKKAPKNMPSDDADSDNKNEEVNSPKTTEKSDEDSSTSDEITLDELLRQQNLKQEVSVASNDKKDKGDCSNESSSSKECDIQNSEPKSSLPLVTSVKLEGSTGSPRSSTATNSPSTVHSSDEDLISVKNRIRVKQEEENSETDDKKSDKSTTKKTSSKSKDEDSLNRSKSFNLTVKKEIVKEDSSKLERQKSDSETRTSSCERSKQKAKKPLNMKKSPTGVKRSRGRDGGSGSDTEQRARRMKLFGFWSGPKRHRVASLNALAKVHCLYENESRGALQGIFGPHALVRTRPSKPTPTPKREKLTSSPVVEASTRTLRSAPGMRGMGKHWDMHNASSTSSSSQSSDDNDSNTEDSSPSSMPPSYKQKQKEQKMPTTAAQTESVKKKSKQIQNVKKVIRRRRNRCELMMDLKDMVVRKRMASLNASAILAASYSVEKRPPKSKEDSGVDGDSSNFHQGKKKKKRVITKKIVEVEDDSSTGSSDVEVEECSLDGRGSGRSVIEVRTTPSGGPNSNKKVAVIVNQDTDVTITGVYVNSTTRSTHHEGFCSIAGMQYRISSTSHTQTEATAVATETVLHTSTAAEHPPPPHHPAEPPLQAPIKSYTPLGALSNMQPPGSAVVGGPPPPHHHHHPHAHPHPHTHPPPCSVPPPPPPPVQHPVNPGGPVHPPISPLGRRHGCTSAFSAPPPPPSGTYGPPSHQPPHHHTQGPQDPAYIHGYYQPAGPLISAHHHHHSSSSSSSSSITNTGKVPPAVLPTIEASPNPTPPPSATSHSTPSSVPTSTTTAVAPPQQIVSATSSGSTGGGARSGGDESSDNDVIITATSCSGGGEVAPPPPVPQPLPLQQHPHQTSYRYQSYPPPPTPSTPQHIHHQSYSYNYPHTQYYPSPPASASIQYSAVATNPPSLQQHHAHYHNQDLCYSTSNYPPASYFHHKSYSTPPPASYHRRYIPPPPHPSQYYPSDLYSNPASNAGQQNSGQSQQNQQMVVTGSGTGSASSYQPQAAPPPPPLVGVSSNPPPPPLVDTYPPPVSIVDYPPPPPYYTGYSAGPGAAGCYSHSPPTRSLAFIDAAYQSCPCPMQSCPKNVHTGPLTGDGKGPHITSKQQQQPVQESGASFHQLPLPPVALALPLEPPGALGPPSPARGSAGMPLPPSPATASARNPSHIEEEAVFQQKVWETTESESQSKHEAKTAVKSKQEPSGEDFVGETQLTSSVDPVQEVQTKTDKEFTDETTTIPSDRLLAISKVTNPEAVVCRAKSRKVSPAPSNNVPLLMCNHDFQKKVQNSSEEVVTKPEVSSIPDAKLVNNIVKTEVRAMEKDLLVENKSSRVIPNGSKTVFRNGSSRKRKVETGSIEINKVETETVPKRHKLSTSKVPSLSVPSSEPAKTNGVCDPQDQVNGIPHEEQTKCKKSQPLSSNSCSLHNVKHNSRKRKLDDTKDLAENKEPSSLPAKKKTTKIQKQTKIYPSRMKQVKKVSSSSEALKKIDEILDSVVANVNAKSDERTTVESVVTLKKNNNINTSSLGKKVITNKGSDRKKHEPKINGVHPHQKKPSLRNHGSKDSLNCVNSDVSNPSKARIAHANVSRVSAECKKTQQRKKSDASLSSVESGVSGKKRRANLMLRSHGLRDSLSEQSSSDDVESNSPKGKVTSGPSPATANRRTSTGSRKEQSKKSSGLLKNHIVKKQAQLQEQEEVVLNAMNALAKKLPPKKILLQPKWSNGWKFEGEPFESRVFLSNDDVVSIRKCYPQMRHEEGDIIYPRDCVLLRSGLKNALPYVAKVAALWENPDDGEMMMSLLWYYRPEHTEQPNGIPLFMKGDIMDDEVFASKHKDVNSVACIEDKCYVLTFNEYCRYRKRVRRIEDGVKEPGLVVPLYESYPRENMQPPGCVAPELVFFCRRVYDFRQKRILKNPG